MGWRISEAGSYRKENVKYLIDFVWVIPNDKLGIEEIGKAEKLEMEKTY